MKARDLIDASGQLFTLPDIALRVSAVVNSPDSDSATIAEVIELDAALAASVLKIANSAFYGMPSKIDTIAKAVTRIGHKALRDLVMSVAVIRHFRGIPSEFVNMGDFWDNSVLCGISARVLARHTRTPEPERLFLAGLLHKIGRLVFYSTQPERYRQVLLQGPRSDHAIAAAEHAVFGFNYAELGAALLKAWKLPEALELSVASQLGAVPLEACPRESAILQVASQMAFALSPDIHTGSLTSGQPRNLGAAQAKVLGLDDQDLVDLGDEAFEQALELVRIVNPR
jgi:HD-like signal output (HDOD) protein